jgi:hypothetical protein
MIYRRERIPEGAQRRCTSGVIIMSPHIDKEPQQQIFTDMHHAICRSFFGANSPKTYVLMDLSDLAEDPATRLAWLPLLPCCTHARMHANKRQENSASLLIAINSESLETTCQDSERVKECAMPTVRGCECKIWM